MTLRINDTQHISRGCHYRECRIFYCYAECRYAEYRYAECHYAEYRYAECRYAEYHYAEYHYTVNRNVECHYGDMVNIIVLNIVMLSGIMLRVDAPSLVPPRPIKVRKKLRP